MADRVSNGGLKTIWWLSAAMTLASSVRLFLILEGKPREARLLQDVAVALIYLSAGMGIVGYAFSLPVGTLVATSGVFAIVLGLALQNTLGDVFSGIALNLGHPISPGHWIVLDDNVQGQVFETSWRSTQYERSRTTWCLYRIACWHGAVSPIPAIRIARTVSAVTVRLALDRPPHAILEAMDHVLLSSNTINKAPSPSATIQAIDKDFIEVGLGFRVADVGKVTAAKNELFDLIYRHAKSIGLGTCSNDALHFCRPRRSEPKRMKGRSKAPLASCWIRLQCFPNSSKARKTVWRNPW